MKKIFLFCLLAASFTACQQNSNTQTATVAERPTKQSTPLQVVNDTIHLVQPDTTLTTSLMHTLAHRSSIREYAPTQLDNKTLSTLLWAANGINRPENGKRTAPSAVNAQDIVLYVTMDLGTFIYLPEQHALQLVSTADLRKPVTYTQEFAAAAPLSIILVSDLTKFPFDDQQRATLLGAMDAGYVSQNIYLYCTAANLATVARGTMDKTAIQQALQLTDKQIPMLNHPVGYTK